MTKEKKTHPPLKITSLFPLPHTFCVCENKSVTIIIFFDLKLKVFLYVSQFRKKIAISLSRTREHTVQAVGLSRLPLPAPPFPHTLQTPPPIEQLKPPQKLFVPSPTPRSSPAKPANVSRSHPAHHPTTGGTNTRDFFQTPVRFFVVLINCWSSVVASVVLPQLCNLHCPNFFQLTFLHPPVRATVGEVRYSIEIDVGGSKGSILQNQILRKILAENGPHA